MTKKSRVDRLQRREEKVAMKKVYYFSAISIVLAFLLFAFGIPLLGKFADLLSMLVGGADVEVDESFIPSAPRLDPLPSATNSAMLLVSGFAEDGTTVAIFLNSEKKGEAKAKDGKFAVENVELKEGDNELYAKAVADNKKESDSSSTVKILFDNDEPSLSIERPSEGESFSQDNRILVSGKTDRDAQVSANGFLAPVEVDGSFEVFVPLVEGENSIEVKATDIAGNTKTETRKVNFKK